jgi:hypothetical protein
MIRRRTNDFLFHENSKSEEYADQSRRRRFGIARAPTMTRDFKRSNLSASSAIMDRLMGPGASHFRGLSSLHQIFIFLVFLSAASVVDDDQSEQPSPVFYVDLKEGRRIDFNVLVRAHNAVHQDKIRADSSYVCLGFDVTSCGVCEHDLWHFRGDESESEAEAECDLNEDDDDEDDDEDEEEEEQHAAANNGANVTANNGTSNATVPATDVGKNDKKRKKPTARRRKEEEYDKDDGFIDDDDMSVHLFILLLDILLVCHISIEVHLFRTQSIHSAAIATVALALTGIARLFFLSATNVYLT